MAGTVRPTSTVEQATERAEDNLRRALAALPGHIRVERIASTHTPCDDPDDGGPPGRVTASVQYQVHDLPADEFARRVDELRAWWTDNGFRELRDGRPGMLYLWVEHNRDGFRMAVQANDLGELYLFSTSPCVWPHGTPEPD